ncbi:acyl-CoA thioesterase [Tumebacillus permanentifrigoris]|uniref:Acyl-CoA thioester hydrolase n=1 Tax=Tumebacillus permanentifrigoris TaxID=378543 RepID=A0A316DTE2_9BACL|nr:thioesterase family protein [Tumebacillus permanentifrigoris]PWK10279.1 acyl-CoA thioester hydrolase [Tumebacillus permanentifrigoris]
MSQESPSHFRFYSPIKVRFAETDMNGHMSHVSPIIYMEQARAEFMESLDVFTPEIMLRERKTFVLARQSIDYKAQAYYNDRLRIYLRVTRIGSSSVDMEYAIVNEQNNLLCCTATTTVVYFDAHQQKSTPLPDNLAERIEQLESTFATV